MSYSSRVYRQRNAHTHDEGQQDSSFGKKTDPDSPEAQEAFFQNKLGVNKAAGKDSVQRLTSTEDEKAGTNDARMRKDKEIQEKPIQKKNDEKKPKEEVKKEDDEKVKAANVQKKEDSGTNAVPTPLSSRIESPSGAGSGLSEQTLNEMNSSFGNDFSDVRIHNDQEAQQMTKDLHAQAFTHGKDIYFNKGKYDPETKEGKSLLAHELTHVVQQNSGDIKD